MLEGVGGGVVGGRVAVVWRCGNGEKPVQELL
jgi:hypothetical protein